MKKPILYNRRQFLFGSGGFFLSIPLLPSLLSQSARGNSSSVSRFVSILRRDGAPIDFWPRLSLNQLTKLGPTTREFDLSKINGDLSYCFGSKFNDLKSDMIILKSINGMEKFGDHGSDCILTAMNYKKFPERNPSGGPYESIDQHIIRKIYGDSDPFEKQLNIQISYSSKRNSYSWYLDGDNPKKHPAYNNPKTIFNDFFNIEKPDSVRDLENEKLVIDKVLAHFNSVKNSKSISKNDKLRLEEFSEEIFSVQSQLDNSNDYAGCVVPSGTNGNYVNLEQRIQQTFKVMTLALKCDRTRVINFDFNPDTIIAPYFNGKGHHGVSHGNSSEYVNVFKNMHKWHNDFIADFIKDLKTEDPFNTGKTILENTLVFMSNEIGNQGNGGQTGNDANHIRVDVPCVLFGNVNKYFKTGRYLDYRNDNTPANNRWYKPLGHPYNQVLTTIMNAYGLTYHDWERNNVRGFGDYRGQLYNKSKPDLMTLGDKRSPLPFIKA